MTSKIVVNNIEADAGVSTVTFGSKISSSEFVGNLTGTASTATAAATALHTRPASVFGYSSLALRTRRGHIPRH